MTFRSRSEKVSGSSSIENGVAVNDVPDAVVPTGSTDDVAVKVEEDRAVGAGKVI